MQINTFEIQSLQERLRCQSFKHSPVRRPNQSSKLKHLCVHTKLNRIILPYQMGCNCLNFYISLCCLNRTLPPSNMHKSAHTHYLRHSISVVMILLYYSCWKIGANVKKCKLFTPSAYVREHSSSSSSLRFDVSLPAALKVPL